MSTTVRVRKCCSVCIWYDAHTCLCTLDRPEFKAQVSVCERFLLRRHLDPKEPL